MEFDITNIDKRLLVQALFAHAAPIGLGKAENTIRNDRGENADGLSDSASLLYNFNNSHSCSESFHIANYYMGKPIKLNFYRNRNGRVIVESPTKKGASK